VSAIVGPKVEHAAQINESPITTTNCYHGKNTPSYNPKIRDSCRDMVQPTTIPTKIPRVQLASTRIIAS